MSASKQPESIKTLLSDMAEIAAKFNKILSDPTQHLMPDEYGPLVTKSYKVHVKTDDMIKDIVHTKRMSGHTDYTQTRALRDGIMLLYQTMQISPRPAPIRQGENKRSMKISLSKTFKSKPDKE